MQADRREIAATFAGGIAGALLRLALVEAFPHDAGEWPWATLIANLAGAFVLGYVVARLAPRLPATLNRLRLLGTGFCGALTTFSTFQLELVRMLEHDDSGLALGYASVSIVAGLALVVAGARIAGRRPAEIPRGVEAD